MPKFFERNLPSEWKFTKNSLQRIMVHQSKWRLLKLDDCQKEPIGMVSIWLNRNGLYLIIIKGSATTLWNKSRVGDCYSKLLDLIKMDFCSTIIFKVKCMTSLHLVVQVQFNLHPLQVNSIHGLDSWQRVIELVEIGIIRSWLLTKSDRACRNWDHQTFYRPKLWGLVFLQVC